MSRRTRWGVLPTAVGLLLIATLARFGALGYEGIWCDEGYTATLISMPFGELLGTLTRTDDAPPLYYLLQKLLVPLTGQSEVGLRSLPALAGILAIVALLLTNGRRRWGSGGWAAAYFALCTYAIFYARQARSYAFLMLLALVLILCARALLLRGPRAARRASGGLVIAAILICLTHHIGVVLILTSLLLWPLRTAQDLSLRRWLLLHAIPLAAWGLLWSASSAQLTAHTELNFWIARFWQDQPLLCAPLYSFEAFLPGLLPVGHRGIAFPTLPETSRLWPVISALLGLLAIVVLACGDRCRHWLKARAADPGEGRAALIEGAFLCLPLGALTIASLIATPVYVVARTDAIAFPAFALLIGRGLNRLPRWLAAGAVLFWAILSFATLAPSYGIGAAGWVKGADRQLAKTITQAGLAPGDWLIHGFLTSPSLEYYLSRGDVAHSRAHFPAEAGASIAAVRPTSPDSLAAYLNEAQDLRARIEADASPNTAVWILALKAPVHAVTGKPVTREARALSAEELSYPTSLLVYAFVGKSPAQAVAHYRQDGVGGERVLLRLPRNGWIPPERLPPILTGEDAR